MIFSYRCPIEDPRYGNLTVHEFEGKGFTMHRPSQGYLSDVKGFASGDRDYLVLSYFFSAETGMHLNII